MKAISQGAFEDLQQSCESSMYVFTQVMYDG